MKKFTYKQSYTVEVVLSVETDNEHTEDDVESQLFDFPITVTVEDLWDEHDADQTIRVTGLEVRSVEPTPPGIANEEGNEEQ